MSAATAAPDVADLRDYAHDWALVDVETSGLVPRQDRVLSIAVITVGPDGEQTGEFSTLLDPGGDPGPVHIHGLTAERLRGAPAFGEVADRIGAMLRGRVLVAHNARFDYDFLAHEFARAGVTLPVARRLCTLALNRQVDPPTDDLRLGTLAAHYGVRRLHAHDALDDTRVLAGVLKASLREAARLELPLPLVACPPRQDPRFTPKPPKAPCGFRNPGRLAPGGPLTQGMKVALTGETAVSRAELMNRAVAAGLNMMSTVSRHTSVLVTNDPASGSAKGRRAAAEGVPVIDETAFLRLLDDVRPGTAHQGAAPADPTAASTPDTATTDTATTDGATTEAASVPPARTPEPSRSQDAEPQGVEPQSAGPGLPRPAPARSGRPRRAVATAGKPLVGRRVLVLGGTHPDAAATRVRIVELGGAAAINLSASVTDVVLLAGGESDRRMRRITSLRLPAHRSDWLDAPTVTAPGSPDERRSVLVLPRGGVADLPEAQRWSAWNLTATWAQRTTCEVDLVAFVVDEEEQVSCDDDFVFYGAPESPDGTVRLSTDGPKEQTITIDLASMPPGARKVVIAAAVDGTPTFGDVGAIQISTGSDGSAAPLAQAALDAATTERTMLLAEIYRRGHLWRFRAVGQGYDHGLDALARGYGVDIAD
ncbi:TerD family protein [Streptomyces sp. NPDC051018]|uniref:TerD family protein n=1 Tax=Streptomyces sp. NPDC051018 TaxID=3365639 RepID=UPI00378E03F6